MFVVLKFVANFVDTLVSFSQARNNNQNKNKSAAVAKKKIKVVKSKDIKQILLSVGTKRKSEVRVA